MRTTPLKEGEPKWDWESKHAGQCTWYCYFDGITANGYAPCYNNRANKTEGYNNGKEWLKNFKEPYMPFYFAETDKMPSAGDYLVFDGTYGHVVKIEAVEGDRYFISQYNLSAPKQFSNDYWTKGAILKGKPYNTGKPLGFLHAPEVKPTVRNKIYNQIYVKTDRQNVRSKASLEADTVCGCFSGYYNVEQKKTADGYTWYKIGNNLWIAGVEGRVEYYEKDATDFEALYKEAQSKLDEIDAILRRNGAR